MFRAALSLLLTISILVGADPLPPERDITLLPTAPDDCLMDNHRGRIWTTYVDLKRISATKLADGSSLVTHTLPSAPQSISLSQNGRWLTALIGDNYAEGNQVLLIDAVFGDIRSHIPVPTSYNIINDNNGFSFLRTNSPRQQAIGISLTDGNQTSQIDNWMWATSAIAPNQNRIFWTDNSSISTAAIQNGIITNLITPNQPPERSIQGKVWITPSGEWLVTRGGNVLTADETLRFIEALDERIEDLCFAHTYFITCNDRSITIRNMESREQSHLYRSQTSTDRIFTAKNIVYRVSDNRLTAFDSPISDKIISVKMPDQLNENAGSLPAAGTVNITTIQSSPVTIELISSLPALTIPSSVTIPAGQTQATFDITVNNDSLRNGWRLVKITPMLTGWQVAPAELKIVDDESYDVSLTLPSEIAEGATATATISLTQTADANLRMRLASNNHTLSVPPEVVIPAGASSASFMLQALEDNYIFGPHNVSISANLGGDNLTTASITVSDNEPNTLTLTFPQSYREDAGPINPGSSNHIRLAGKTPVPLSITLTSSDVSELSLPASVVIPADESWAPIAININDDDLRDGTQQVTITAAASNFQNGTANLRIVDDDINHIVVEDLPTESHATASWSFSVRPKSIDNQAITGPRQWFLRALESDITITPLNTWQRSGEEKFDIDIDMIASSAATGVTLVLSTSSGYSHQLPTIQLVRSQQKTVLSGHFNDMSLIPGPANIYLVERSRRMLHHLNLASGAISKSFQLNREPEAISVSPDGKFVHVALIHGQHRDDWPIDEQSGEIVRIALSNERIIHRYPIALDPWDLVTTKNGELIISGGSSNSTKLLAHRASTGQKLSEVWQHQRSQLAVNRDGDGIFAWPERQYHVYHHDFTSGILGDGSASDRNSYNTASNIWIDPNNRFILLNNGQVLSADTTMSDLGSLPQRRITDVTFGHSHMVIAQDNRLFAYDLATRSLLGSRSTSATVTRVFVIDNKLIWASEVNGQTTFCTEVGLFQEPLIHIDVAGETFAENAGAQDDAITFSIPAPQSSDVNITIDWQPASDLNLVRSVVIPAGQQSARINLTPVDNNLLDGSRRVELNATATGFHGLPGHVIVTDDESTNISLVAPDNVTEGQGILGGRLQINLSANPDRDIRVSLTSQDTTEINLPAHIVIPAGSTTAYADLEVQDDILLDGDVSTLLTASVTGWQSGNATVEVRDNEAMTLSTNGPTRVWEADTNAIVVQLTGVTLIPRTIQMTNSNPQRLSIPATAIIAAGTDSVSIPYTAIDDQSALADETVSIQINSSDFTTTNGPHIVTIRDNDPYLVNVYTPAFARSGITASTTFNVRNYTGDLIPDLTENYDLEIISGSGTITPAGITIAGNGTAIHDLTVTSLEPFIQLGISRQGQRLGISNPMALISLPAPIIIPHEVTDCLVDQERGRFWATVSATKSTHCYDLANRNQLASWQSNWYPESLTIESDGDAVYGALATGQRSSYWDEDEQVGGIRRFNAETLELTHDRIIDLDPHSIKTNQNGIVYIGGGSSQWTYLMAYDPIADIDNRMSSWRQQDGMDIAPTNDRILFATGYELGVIEVDDLEIGNKRTGPRPDNVNIGRRVWTSGNGGWMMDDNGHVVSTGLSPSYLETLPVNTQVDYNSKINHVESGSDLTLAAIDQHIHFYDTDSRDELGIFHIGINVTKMFRWDNALVLVSVNSGTTRIYVLDDMYSPGRRKHRSVILFSNATQSAPPQCDIRAFRHQTPINGQYRFDLIESGDATFTLFNLPASDG